MKEKKPNKLIQFEKGCPLAVLIAVSIVVLSVAGVIYDMVKGIDIKVSVDKPLFADILTLAEAAEDESDDAVLTEEPVDESQEITTSQKKDAGSDEEQPTKNTEEETGYITQFVEKKKVKEDSPYYDDPGVVALTTDFPCMKVGDEYFDDALFIGDSRMEGLKLYSGITNATFYAKEGTTIYKIMDEKIAGINVNGKDKNVTVEKALKENKFGKIYIMLGINELGYKTSKDFGAKYKEVVDKIRQLQPDAVIYLMGIMKVTQDYQKGNDVFNNENINSKNVEIARIADGKKILYLDVNVIFEDENNALDKKYSWDGVHLQAEYYELIREYLKERALSEKEEQTTNKRKPFINEENVTTEAKKGKKDSDGENVTTKKQGKKSADEND